MNEKELSKNLLQMKFMQRTKDRLDFSNKEKTTKKLEEKFLSTPSSEKKIKFVVEPRIAILENFLECGRRSFKGFNPEVEKCMTHYHSLKQEEIDKQDRERQGRDVGDKEMASRYASLSNTLAKKFTTKRRRAERDADDDDEPAEFRAKRKFRKPLD